MAEKEIPDIDIFAKRFATDINRILHVDYDPRVLRVRRLLEAKDDIPEAERQLLVKTLERVSERCRFWALQLTPIILIILALALTATAQTFPRWPDNQAILIYTLQGTFTPDEHSRICAAVKAWQPMMPAGISMKMAFVETDAIQECQGCVTLDRESVIKSRWAECESHTNDKGLTKYAIIRIDPRAGSDDKFQRRVEHEIGHALGLDHRPDSIMTERPQGKPGEGDAAILRMIYAKGESNASSSAISTRASREPRTERDLSEGIKRSLVNDETANTEALKSHQWTLAVSIQTLDEDDKPNGDYSRISRVVLDDKGRRYERVLSKYSHLKGMRITKADEQDFVGAQMGLIDNFADYRFTAEPVGIRVTPFNLNGRRFSGIVFIGDKGIYRFIGTTLPEKSEKFPTFTVIRKEVEGHLFPAEMSSEGVL